MVMPSSMSNFGIGPCLMVIFLASASTLRTRPSVSACAQAAAPPSISAPASATAEIVLFMRRSPSVSFYANGAVHAGLAVAGDQAGEFERAAFAEAPEDVRALAGVDALGVRVVVLHVGIFLHQFGVLGVVGDAGQHEFVLQRALVLDDEA